MNPYILPQQQMQDVSGLQPVFQNFGQQQANQQAALAQQNQLMNQAGQSQGGGMNPLALASMLRKGDEKKSIDKANTEMAAFNNRPAQNYYSAGMNPMNIISDE
jgi:hypothetical protein